MNRGYSWTSQLIWNFDRIVKRACVNGEPVQGPRIGHECIACGRVFKRKHVRWVGDGWLCRDRCERNHRGLP